MRSPSPALERGSHAGRRLLTPSHAVAALTTALLVLVLARGGAQGRCRQAQLQLHAPWDSSQLPPGLPRLLHQSWKTAELPERWAGPGRTASLQVLRQTKGRYM